MRLFTLLLVWFSVLFVEVLSNNSSIGYEFLYFYYVYKMEIASGVSPRTIATGCPGTAPGRMCYFSEFAHYLMENRWKNVYEPAAGDKTLTPDASNLVKLNQNIPSSARFIINDLSSALHGVTSMPVVVNTLLNVANTAIATGNVDNDDVKAALANSEAAKLARAPNVFSDQMTAFEAEVEEAAQKYLVSQNLLVDWDATFEAIDDDEYEGKITADQAESYKQSIRSFSLTFGTEGSGAATSTITHVAVMREFSTAIEQLNQRVVESSSDGSLRAPSDTCDDDFLVFGSDSDKRKRHLVEISSVVGKRKPMLARIPIPGISGKKVLRFGSEL